MLVRGDDHSTWAVLTRASRRGHVERVRRTAGRVKRYLVPQRSSVADRSVLPLRLFCDGGEPVEGGP